MKLECFSCHTTLEFSTDIGRREECSHCRADVRVCKNCEFYDPRAYNECRETSADVIVEKERANFCDFFKPGSGLGVKQQKDDLLSAAEALFKKS